MHASYQLLPRTRGCTFQSHHLHTSVQTTDLFIATRNSCVRRVRSLMRACITQKCQLGLGEVSQALLCSTLLSQSRTVYSNKLTSLITAPSRLCTPSSRAGPTGGNFDLARLQRQGLRCPVMLRRSPQSRGLKPRTQPGLTGLINKYCSQFNSTLERLAWKVLER